MEYNFSGQINFNDFMQFQQNNLKGCLGKIYPKNSIYFAIILWISVIIYDMYYRYSFQRLIIYIIITVLIGLFLLILYYSKGLYKKLFKDDVSNLQTCNFKINENKIIIEYEKGIMEFTKDNIHKILFDNDSIYIYKEPNIAKIIKKRFFDNEDIFENLKLFIKENYVDKNKENNNKCK